MEIEQHKKCLRQCSHLLVREQKEQSRWWYALMPKLNRRSYPMLMCLFANCSFEVVREVCCLGFVSMQKWLLYVPSLCSRIKERKAATRLLTRTMHAIVCCGGCPVMFSCFRRRTLILENGGVNLVTEKVAHTKYRSNFQSL